MATSDKKFSDVFRERIDKIDRDARAAGINMTIVCAEAGIARANPDRWRRQIPKTIKSLDLMEKVVALHSIGKSIK